tara:strand:- start:6 stop:236 length:231 start_codon:yes stop_codon:yes gene_type:complete
MSRREARGYRCLFLRKRNDMSMVPECPVCGASITINIYNEIGELIDCEECDSMLEITSIDPPQINEAPEEEEDWGE